MLHWNIAANIEHVHLKTLRKILYLVEDHHFIICNNVQFLKEIQLAWKVMIQIISYQWKGARAPSFYLQSTTFITALHLGDDLAYSKSKLE